MKYLIFGITFFVLLSCRKQIVKHEQKRLPRATEKGKGVFACYVEDHTFIFKKNPPIIYNKTTGYLALNIIGNRSTEFRLFIYEGVFSTGNYQFSLTGEEYLLNATSNPYYIQETGLNQIEITKLDLEYKIISGNFNFDLINALNKTKKVRNGRFDLELKIIS